MKDTHLTSFADLGLSETLLRALDQQGYKTPTPVQAGAIPHILDGRDLLGLANTGTGKTAAFALPLLQRLAGGRPAAPGTCRALIMAPTRELAQQISNSLRAYGRNMKLSIAEVVGGVAYGPQIRALRRGVDILVATPGRLIDHMDNGMVRVDGVETVVLDEADHMLDLGFLVPIRRILSTMPDSRQTLLFSATMPGAIAKLANDMMNNPAKVSVATEVKGPSSVEQRVYLVKADEKRDLLLELLDGDGDFSRTIVFTRTKRGADRLSKALEASGHSAASIHGDKSQGQRNRVLSGFKAGRTKVLVATDVAARGIDVHGVTHVVNFELPEGPDGYVHRIGRTGRAGETGTAISFCARDERRLLRDIERANKQPLEVVDRDPGGKAEEPAARGRRGGNGGGRPGAGPRNGNGRPNAGRPGGHAGMKRQQEGRPQRGPGQSRRSGGERTYAS